MTFPRLRSAALAVVVAAVAAACDSATQVVPADVAGGANEFTSAGSSWALQTVNAKPLPAEIRHDATGGVWVTKGRITFSGNAFSQVLTLSETNVAGQTTTRDSWTQGTYTMSGNQLRFVGSDGAVWVGTYSPSQISYAIPGNSGPITFVFARE